MSLITLDCPITRSTVTEEIFAELVSKKIHSMAAITEAIDDVLKYWNDFLMDNTQFFSYIAAIIAPLLLSQNASFDFNNLKDSCTSIRPDNSCKLLTEVSYKIDSFKEIQNIVCDSIIIFLLLYSIKYIIFLPLCSFNQCCFPVDLFIDSAF